MPRNLTLGQGGQALVGALVVTTLAFLMAGAIAVGASALLSQESGAQNANSRDLAVQDALTAAVAAVAGRGRSAGNAPCSSTTTLSTTLPSGYVSQATCTRVDGIPPQTPALLPLRWSGSCGLADLTNYSGNQVELWFSARGAAGAWVDSRSSGCRPRSPVCAGTAMSGPIGQLYLNCDFSSGDGDGNGNGNNNGSQYLHVVNLASSPALVRLLPYDRTAGSIYVLAAGTGVAGGPSYEEADIWVSRDGASTALRFEGVL
jgi:hypothetical protein